MGGCLGLVCRAAGAAGRRARRTGRQASRLAAQHAHTHTHTYLQIATVLLYLSDVDEGGETSFLLEGRGGLARLANIDYKACDTGIKVGGGGACGLGWVGGGGSALSSRLPPARPPCALPALLCQAAAPVGPSRVPGAPSCRLWRCRSDCRSSRGWATRCCSGTRSPTARLINTRYTAAALCLAPSPSGSQPNGFEANVRLCGGRTRWGLGWGRGGRRPRRAQPTADHAAPLLHIPLPHHHPRAGFGGGC